MTIKTKTLTRLNMTLLNLKRVLDYVPSNTNKILYTTQKKYLIDNTINTIKIIDNYFGSIKKKYNLQKELIYPINYTHSLEQIIINMELIGLMYKGVLNVIDINPSEIIKLSQLLDIYFKKIDVFIKYPSNWIGLKQAVWNP